MIRTSRVLAVAACVLTLVGFGGSHLAVHASGSGPPQLTFPFPADQTWRITCGYTLPEGDEREVCGHSGSKWNRYALDFQHAGGRAAAEGQPVLAAADGRVWRAAFDDGLGWHVFLDHGDGYTTAYGHMKEVPVVPEGAQVRRGQVLGFVGCTGHCTGDHIHFVLWKDGESVPPEPICGRTGFEPGQLLDGCVTPPALPGTDFDGDGLPDAAFFYRDAAGARLDVPARDGAALGAPVALWRGEAASAPDIQTLLAGDFTGDGAADVAALARGPGCDSRLLVFVSHEGALHDPAPWWSAGDGCTRPIRDAASGDFDGDGLADVALLYQDPIGETSIEVFRSTGDVFAPEDAPRWRTEAVTLTRASRLLAGDFTGDGSDDLAVLFGAYDCQKQVRVLSFDGGSSGSGLAEDWWRTSGCLRDQITDVAVSDFDGDGRDDVALLGQDGPGTRGIDVLRSTGDAFEPGAGPWWQDGGQATGGYARALAPGDFTGDGRADLVLLLDDGSCTSRLLVLGSLGVAFLPGERWSSEAYCADSVLGAAP